MDQMLTPREIPRLAPEQAFPAYSYVPGLFPHPVSDPRGHSFGVKPHRLGPLHPDQWHSFGPYLYGIDLFNHGYYWEAHEVWEGLWHACGRSGPIGRFLKGLIKLAAAGVKVRQGIPRGVKTHALRAVDLFRQTAEEVGGEHYCYLGLCLGDLIRFGNNIAVAPCAQTDGRAVMTVFDFVLAPA